MNNPLSKQLQFYLRRIGLLQQAIYTSGTYQCSASLPPAKRQMSITV